MPNYCEQADLEKRKSAIGVALRLDDDPPAIEDVLENATGWIDFYCLPRYEAAQLLLSAWVKHRAADIGVYLLCVRRMNPVPKSAQLIYDIAIKALEKVQAGNLNIPGIEPRKTPGPFLSQPRAIMFPTPHTVIERNRSTGSPQGYSRRDDPYEAPDSWGN